MELVRFWRGISEFERNLGLIVLIFLGVNLKVYGESRRRGSPSEQGSIRYAGLGVGFPREEASEAAGFHGIRRCFGRGFAGAPSAAGGSPDVTAAFAGPDGYADAAPATTTVAATATVGA